MIFQLFHQCVIVCKQLKYTAFNELVDVCPVIAAVFFSEFVLSSEIIRCHCDGAFETFAYSCIVKSRESAHAVAYHKYIVKIYMIFLCIILNELKSCLCVVENIGEQERSGRSPAAGIVESENVETASSECLHHIQVLLVSREAVQQQYRRLWICSACCAEQRIEPSVIAVDQYRKIIRCIRIVSPVGVFVHVIKIDHIVFTSI